MTKLELICRDFLTKNSTAMEKIKIRCKRSDFDNVVNLLVLAGYENCIESSFTRIAGGFPPINNDNWLFINRSSNGVNRAIQYDWGFFAFVPGREVTIDDLKNLVNAQEI